MNTNEQKLSESQRSVISGQLPVEGAGAAAVDDQTGKGVSGHQNDLAGKDLPLLGSYGKAGAGAPSEAWPVAVEGWELLTEIAKLLARFVVLPKWAAETLALWILHTYAYELRDITAYLGIESPEKRCGKTTLLSVLVEMVNRPVIAANISPSAFFRVIQQTRPTLMIDEADTFLRGNEELRGILNSGCNQKGGYVWRVVNQVRNAECGARNGGPKPEEGRDVSGNEPIAVRFSCWCPKVVATIGKLPDTLADRCIMIRMQRKMEGERCERLRNLDAMALRRKCLRFVQDNAAGIAAARPGIPEELNDRAADVWEPLLALADLAGGDWPGKARQAAIGLSTSAQEGSVIGSLLFDLFGVFSINDWKRMFTWNIVNTLNMRFHQRPWQEMLNGKEVTDIWLAKQLRPYGIRPKTIWIGDDHAKGYEPEEFEDVFRRYIPMSEVTSSGGV